MMEETIQYANLINNFGVGVAILSLFLSLFGGMIIWLLRMLNNTIKETKEHNKSIVIQMKESQQSNEDNFKEFTKENKEAIMQLSKSITEVFSENRKELDSLSNQVCDITNTLNGEKKWSDSDYKEQVKNILTISILNIQDYVLIKIDRNNLYGNNDIIKQEIKTKVDKIIDKGREKIMSIPYSASFDIKLFKKTDILKDKATNKISEILDVKSDDYNPESLKRKVRLLSEEMQNETDRILGRLIEEEGNGKA